MAEIRHAACLWNDCELGTDGGGFIVTGLILVPFLGVNEYYAQVMPIGFAGGHGTAAALATVFEDYGFPAGGDCPGDGDSRPYWKKAMVGIIMVNYAAAKNWVKYSRLQTGTSRLAMKGLLRRTAPYCGAADDCAGLHRYAGRHLVVVGMACFIGYLIVDSRGCFTSAQCFSSVSLHDWWRNHPGRIAEIRTQHEAC